MMKDRSEKTNTQKSLFSGITLVCLIIGSVLLYSSLKLVQAGEAREGYSSFNIGLSVMVAVLLSGVVTGQIALARGEKPLVLPVLALLLNGAIFIAVVILIPR